MISEEGIDHIGIETCLCAEHADKEEGRSDDQSRQPHAEDCLAGHEVSHAHSEQGKEEIAGPVV